MDKVLIVPNFSLNLPKEQFDSIVRLDDKFMEVDDIFCFIPNRPIVSKSKNNICFIPYGPDSWNHKQRARSIGFTIGDENFAMVDTDYTWPLHKKIGISHNKELNVAVLTINLLIENPDLEVTLFEQPNLSGKERVWLDKLIESGKVKLFNGK